MADALSDGTDSPHAAFGALSDPVRLDVLRALWDHNDRTMTFSALQEAVAVDDSGRFNYHLSKLRGQFVRQTADGYTLTTAGTEVIGTLVSNAYTTANPRSFELATACSNCAQSLSFQYERGIAAVECTNCEHVSFRVALPPGVFESYDTEQWPTVASRYVRHRIQQAVRGFCPVCEGRVRSTLQIGTPDGMASPQSELPMVEYICRQCGSTTSGSVATVLLEHAEVIAFFVSHDIDLQSLALFDPAVSESVSWEKHTAEPLRVIVTFERDDDRLRLAVDESVSVRPAPPESD